MSSSLTWEPPPQESDRHCLDLKYEIGKYFDEDYNGGNDTWTADRDLIPFLKGIIATGDEHQVRSAKELIAAIEKHGKVILTIS